jgi:hypothetical protein
VTTWLRAVGIRHDSADYYYFLAPLGRKAESVACTVYNETATKTYKTFLATYRPAGGDRSLAGNVTVGRSLCRHTTAYRPNPSFGLWCQGRWRRWSNSVKADGNHTIGPVVSRRQACGRGGPGYAVGLESHF